MKAAPTPPPGGQIPPAKQMSHAAPRPKVLACLEIFSSMRKESVSLYYLNVSDMQLERQALVMLVLINTFTAFLSFTEIEVVPEAGSIVQCPWHHPFWSAESGELSKESPSSAAVLCLSAYPNCNANLVYPSLNCYHSHNQKYHNSSLRNLQQGVNIGHLFRK